MKENGCRAEGKEMQRPLKARENARNAPDSRGGKGDCMHALSKQCANRLKSDLIKHCIPKMHF